MANAYLVSNLVSSLKRRGFIPTNSEETFGTADFLAMIDEELRSFIVPLLRDADEDYLTETSDIAVASGQAAYAIPSRAVTLGLDDVALNNGNGAFVPLERLKKREAQLLPAGGPVAGYYLKGNSVVLVPTPSAAGTLRLTYFQRPNRLVEATAVGEISAINTATRQVTISGSSLPATFTASALFDLVKGTPGFECHGIDRAVSGIVGTILTFSATLPTGLAVGDFVCLAGDTPIPQIPVELHPLLAQRVTYLCLRAQKDPGSADALDAVLRMREDAVKLLTPRVADAPEYVINRHGPGWGRR